MLERVYSDTPRILAIQDVHLVASPQTAERLLAFYQDLVGLTPIDASADTKSVSFRGVSRSDPKLIVSFMNNPPTPRPRRALLVRVGSLYVCAEAMQERSLPYEWIRGWSFFDRRLAIEDPAGHRVEIVAYHGF